MEGVSDEVSIVGRPDNRNETKMPYYYGASAIFFISIILCVAAFVPSYVMRRPFVVEEVICTSRVCEAASDMLNHSINDELDPCDDFYAYVCDGWQKSHLLRPQESQRSVFGDVDEKVRNRMHQFLLNATTNETRSDIKYLAVLYKACIKSLTPEGNGVVSMKRFLRRLGMFWPDLEVDVARNGTDILETLVSLSMTWNVEILFSYSVKSLSKSKGAIVFGPPVALIPGKVTDAKKERYTKFIVSMAFLFGRRSNYDDFAKRIVAIETDIARLRVQERASVTLMVQELDNLCADFPWQSWLLVLNKNLPRDAALTPDKSVIVHHPAYVGRLLTYFLNHEYPEDIKAYLALRVLLTYGQTTYEIRHLEEIMLYTGKEIRQDYVVKTCQHWTSHLVRDAWNGFVVAALTTTSTLDGISKLVSNIKQVFIRRIQSVSWMDAQTKGIAALKANNIVFNIPSLSATDDKAYRSLQHLQGDFLDMVFTVNQLAKTDKLFSLSQIVDHSDAAATHSKANAVYVYSINTVNINAALLVSPFFVEGLPLAMNYGGIGVVIAHEIIHGFDVSGRLYDDIGGFNDWWTNTTSAGYRASARCFAEQMQALAHQRGSVTLEENVADNGGLRCAYSAYALAASAATGVVELKGLDNLEEEQLFFVNYCYKFCGTVHTADSQDSPYPLGRFRCNVPIMNFPEFATAFECEPGSAMNPSNRCAVW
ncbi:neprilysin-1-like [Ornithodoros turicata]|uniref:neprilysin-1-like n=1 Tax=Ornithodoros turicata TaxID=34597 RepID=UPI003138A39D